MKKNVKIVIDICMSLILLFVMAYQVTGDKYHEFLGAGMLVLFIAHNVLNFKWYSHIFKGKYSAVRVLRVIVNLATLVAILLTGYSGIVMSQHVFAFLPINGGMMTARKLHLACSYWAFVMMSVHLGLHWNMVAGKIKTNNKIVVWAIRIVMTAIAVYGAYLFGSSNIYSYMLLRTHFAMFDYSQSAAVVLLHNVIMMVAWVYAGYYLNKGLIKRENAPYILLAALVLVVSIVSAPKSAYQSSGWGGQTGTQGGSSWTPSDSMGIQ